MSSPEIVTRVKELTTPPAGESDISYALVVPANKGSYEPKWNTGINEFKKRYTPNGVFEAKSSSAMYAAKKYCEAGNVQLLTVRPDTGALMSGLKIINEVPSVEFTNIGTTGTLVNIGDVATYNKNSYICKVATTVPATIDSTWLNNNFIQVESSGTVSKNIIDFNTLRGLKQGSTLYFSALPSTATFSGVQTADLAYFAVIPQATLQKDDVIFGWYKNGGSTTWNFGYAVYTISGSTASFVNDTTVTITNNLYTLEKDVMSGTNSFWTASAGLTINYDYATNIQLQTNVETYTDIKDTGYFTSIPQSGTIITTGTGIWYASTPYLCTSEAPVPSTVTAGWINYYFTPVGKVAPTNYEAWTTGVNDISEYEQADNELMTIYTSNGGLWGNKTAITILNYEDDPDLIEVEGCFQITFYDNGNQVEQYIVSRQEGLLDANGNSMYIEDVINKRSEDYRVKDSALPSNLLPNTIQSPVLLGGGANGTIPTEAQLIQALNLMEDESSYPLFAVGDGGIASKNYAKAIQTFVNNRKGTKGVICVPADKVVASSMSQAYSNISEYIVSLNMSDSKMRIEEYWGYEFDPDTGKQVLIPPDGNYIRNEALTKNNEGLYFPNAGWSNGMLDVDLVNKWSKGYRDLLDKAKCNYARYDKSRGSAIFSEQTMLAVPSYLQQDHIVKVLLDITPKHINLLEKYLLRLAEPGVFNQILHDMDASMRIVLNAHGCSWFENQCSEVNNSQETLDSQEVNVWCEWQPIGAIKRITLTYGLTNQSVRLVDVQA